MAGSITDIADRKFAAEQHRQIELAEQRRSEQEHIQIVEQVQEKIGRELHDNLGQQLTGISFLVKAMQSRLIDLPNAEREQMAWVVKLVNEAIDNVRFISRQLSPLDIDAINLVTALERLADDVRRIFGLAIDLRASGDISHLSNQHASQLFRIAQESVNNALRHASATCIEIRLRASNCVTHLLVRDNGKGFRLADLDPRASLGLRSMSVRTNTLPGRLRIRSDIASGTTIAVRFDARESLAAQQPSRQRRNHGPAFARG